MATCLQKKFAELVLLCFVGDLRTDHPAYQQQKHGYKQKSKDLCHTRQNFIHDVHDWQLRRNKSVLCQRVQQLDRRYAPLAEQRGACFSPSGISSEAPLTGSLTCFPTVS